jgi:1-acyl-sn-glycerol-3-phosphate acyltransferase
MSLHGNIMTDAMPPVANRLLYIYRITIKFLCFFIFGLGSLILVLLVFPVMLIVFHPKTRFKKTARPLISASFRKYIRFMEIIQVLKLDAENPEAFRNLSSRIVVANHPSLLDVVMLISLIPNADVIVKGSLVENIIVRGIIRRLYILNSLNFEELVEACKESLEQGNCIVIFPEGTRTPRSGGMRLKKGAARLSILSGCGITAVHIGGTDKYGLGKHDPLAAFNRTDKYVYHIKIQGCLSPAKYQGMEMPKAVRRLNEEIRESVSAKINR